MNKEDLNNYIKDFKILSLREKQNIIIGQLKILASLTNTMCKELNIDNEIMVNKELLDVEKNDYTEDDFAEAIVILINSIQNSLCDFDLKISDFFKKMLQN